MEGDLTATTTATYDRIVIDYARRSAFPPSAYVEFRDTFMTMLARGARLADLGCGPGHDLRWFTGHGLRAVGVDASIAMAREARRTVCTGGGGVVLGDLRRLPLATAGLDGVWSSASLLHVPREQVPATLAGWRRSLRDGGALGLSTSLGEGEGWEVVPYARDLSPDDPLGDAPLLHRWFVHHRRAALLAALADAGFAVVQADERRTHRRWLQVLARAS